MRLQHCRRAARTAAAVLVAPLAAACGGGDPVGTVACTDNIVHGIRGTARNATTNADITAGAYLVAIEGTYKDSVSATGGVLLAASERAGTYTVRIGRPGYFAFTRDNVVVGRDECHVIPVAIQANLNPAPAGPS